MTTLIPSTRPDRDAPVPRTRSPRLADPRPWAVLVPAATALLWVSGGGVGLLLSGGYGTWLAVGQIMGLVAALGSLAGLILVARPGWLERRAGLDRMIGWHRIVGITTLAALSAHVVASTTGFAGGSLLALPSELLRLLGEEPWMVAALVSLLLFVAVSLTSWHRLKARLPYETWYFLHLTGYLAVLLGFMHQITLGRDFADAPVARVYWIGLTAATFAVVLWSRAGGVLRSLLRAPITVTDVEPVANGTVALTLAGRGVSSLAVRPGQFLSVRFLAPGLWWQCHPFSLSGPVAVDAVRITVKDLGDASHAMQSLQPGTRVCAQGPYGRMTADCEASRPVVLVGAGVGLAPMCSILSECAPQQRPIVIARAHARQDIPHLVELERLVGEREGRLFLALGSRHRWRNGNPFTPDLLRDRVPDIAQRGAYVCGPRALQAAAERGLRAAGIPREHIHSERFGW